MVELIFVPNGYDAYLIRDKEGHLYHASTRGLSIHFLTSPIENMAWYTFPVDSSHGCIKEANTWYNHNINNLHILDPDEAGFKD